MNVATYPRTTLEDDTLDAPFGGQPAAVFGAKAWTWVNNVLRLLSRAHLLHNRNPFRTLVVRVIDGVDPGHVVVIDLRGNGAPAESYACRKAATGDDGLFASGVLLYLGVVIEGASAGKRAVVASAGVVPYTVTGFGVATAGTPVSVDLATARLKVAAAGETVLGMLDTRGNVVLIGS